MINSILDIVVERTLCGVQGASAALPFKLVTREDAEAVVNAERRNSPHLTTYPGGVASSMETAARLNENTNVRYTQ